VRSGLHVPVHPVRFVTAAALFDGHDAAINIMRRILQSQGAEVIHLGHDRSAREVVDAVLDEDAQGVAISSYQGGHMEYFEYLARLGEHATTPVNLAADSVHTIVVLDDSSGLKVDAVTDAAGSRIMPAGAISAGFGGTAPRPSANPAAWLVMIAAGALLIAAGLARMRRPA
jgi:methylmalonyl-CoA mutase